MPLYMPMGARPRAANMDWTFPAGWTLGFAHLEHENTVYDWQGSQIPFIGFDELTHFSSTQFWYMFSRNRSISGVKPYIRATTNPDADSWVRQLVDWFIGPDGYPIKERSGVLRYFIRLDDTIYWAMSPGELTRQFPTETPKSFTFIPAKVEDNAILMEKDPGYISNLNALSRVERERLRGGNWNVRASAGMMFRRHWFPTVEAVPPGWIQAIRFWDRAATAPSEVNKNPDWTRGLKLYKYPDNTFCIVDIRSMRDTPGQVERLITATAAHDGGRVRIMSQQDPGSAGVSEAEHFKKMLCGYDVRTIVLSKDKETRAKAVSAQAEAGNIKVLQAPWNEEFFAEAERFPEGDHDDQVDTLSGAFNALSTGYSILDVL